MGIVDKMNDLIEQLQVEEIVVSGRLIDASNATLFGHLKSDKSFKVIYKPIAGERPLWDFPDGSLAAREMAAYLFSEKFDFNIVPPTVLREGPFGYGVVQKWIDEAQPDNLIQIAQSSRDDLRSIFLFDVLINNADRKYGHILVTKEDRVMGCDHGISFHSEDKLRTVLWQFGGLEINSNELGVLKQIEKFNFADFEALLSANEIEAIFSRAKNLLQVRYFPTPAEDRPSVPWPPV